MRTNRTAVYSDLGLNMLKNVPLYTFLIFILNAGFMPQSVSAHEEKVDNSWWWSNSWWNEGKITTPKNYDVKVTWSSYDSNGVDVPMMVVRPARKGKFPAVFFQVFHQPDLSLLLHGLVGGLHELDGGLGPGSQHRPRSTSVGGGGCGHRLAAQRAGPLPQDGYRRVG